MTPSLRSRSRPARLARTLLALVLLAGLAACEAEPEPAPPTPRTSLRTDGSLDFLRPDGSVIRSIAIEVADDPEERQRGLMDLRKLSLDEGMLFLFDDEAERNFWMQNTPISLDIIYVGADSQVVSIARRTTPLSPDRVPSGAPAQFVVEVRGGFSDRFGLTDSTRVRWTID